MMPSPLPEMTGMSSSSKSCMQIGAAKQIMTTLNNSACDDSRAVAGEFASGQTPFLSSWGALFATKAPCSLLAPYPLRASSKFVATLRMELALRMTNSGSQDDDADTPSRPVRHRRAISHTDPMKRSGDE